MAESSPTSSKTPASPSLPKCPASPSLPKCPASPSLPKSPASPPPPKCPVSTPSPKRPHSPPSPKYSASTSSPNCPVSPPTPPKCPVSPPSPKCPANRILRCFSGRYNVTVDEVKRFINVSTLVTNEKAKEIFRHFLETNKSSLALQALKCYELADRQLNDVDSRTENNYEELKELMPGYIWEVRLDDAINKKNEQVLADYFLELMVECKRTIEAHRDFERYRESMLDKLNKCTC